MKKKAKSKPNTFKGKNAIRDFLDPHNLATPLVELPPEFNPFHDKGVEIYAKLSYLSPLLNVKSIIAYEMIRDAKKRGKTSGVHTLVEASSGNTAMSLAIMSKLFDIEHVLAKIPADIAPGKFEMLRLFRAHPELMSAGTIDHARKLGKQKGYHNLGQYENEANPQATEQLLAAHIWEQTDGDISVFCASLGTGGTAIGARRYFKKTSPKTVIVGVACKPGHAVPGARTKERLKEVKLDWQSALDACMEVETKESFKASLELCRIGILAGPSSGLALIGLHRFLGEKARDGTLKDLRGKNGKIVSVFICADTCMPYLDKYSTHLDPENF